jgi:hypothetical protein
MALQDKGRVRVLGVRFQILLDEHGQVLGQYAFGDSAHCEHEAGFFRHFQVPLMAFCLANCKNITAEPERGYCKPRGGRKSDRKTYRYHVLKISGSQAGSGKQSSSIGQSLTALHSVRGHFKHFTAERPLLGKHVGMYWWPQHARGDAKAGVVGKEYEVEATNDAER